MSIKTSDQVIQLFVTFIEDSQRAAAAQLAWQRSVDFLRRHLA